MSNLRINLEETSPVADIGFEPLDRRYKSAHMTGTASFYVVMMGLALLLLLLDNMWIFIIAESIIAIIFLFNMLLLRKAYCFKGYVFREHDVSYRSGIIFPTVTTIPYSRIQQVSLRQNPVGRLFKLYSVGIVNGAQALSSLTIPGLSEEKARQLKDFVTDKLRDCHD